MADRLTPLELVDQLPFAELPVLAEAGLDRRARGALSGKALTELWKYTPVVEFVSGLKDAGITQPEFGGLKQPGISLTSLANDALSYPAFAEDAASTARFPLADLALLISGDLLVVRISETPERPLALSTTDGLTPPIVIIVESGVRLELVERAECRTFGNQSLYLQLNEGASVEHASTALTDNASHWALTQVRQEAGSRYCRQQYQRGGKRRRTETQILLCGNGASTEITGAYVVDSGAHLDQQLVVEHRARDTFSRQKFHGIGAGKGTAVFNGRIHIHPGAPGSDAELTNRNLALHADATINTKPELEIYTDDVKCAHGATVGQISDESLFYLRSRGLDPDDAKRMLCRAFIHECITGALAQTAEAALLAGWAEAPEQR